MFAGRQHSPWNSGTSFSANSRPLKSSSTHPRPPDGFSVSCVGFAILAILFCILVAPPADAQSTAKNVLILHNWASLPRSWELMKSTVRNRVPEQVNFYTASVENPRFEEKAYQESMAETLR